MDIFFFRDLVCLRNFEIVFSDDEMRNDVELIVFWGRKIWFWLSWFIVMKVCWVRISFFIVVLYLEGVFVEVFMRMYSFWVILVLVIKLFME